jgi:hypothetical protein
MTETALVRLLLAKFYEDTEPVVVAAIDRAIWEHWSVAEEDEWRKQGQKTWGMDPSDCEWQEVWATFSPDALIAAFNRPVVQGEVLP